LKDISKTDSFKGLLERKNKGEVQDEKGSFFGNGNGRSISINLKLSNGG
jgi:hypothetical protein